MKKRLVCMGLMCMMLLVGCETIEEPVETTTKETVPRIGLSFDSFVIERWQRDRDTFVSKVNELGGEVYVQNGNGNTSKQIEQINYFIEERMDAIVIICADNEALSKPVRRAKELGIPVIAYDRIIKNADVDLYVTFDNERVGELMGESIRENTPEDGNISIVFGSQADGNVEDVETGFNRALEGSNIHILDKEYAPGWLAEVGFQATTENLNKGRKPDGICCGNDDIASQAIKALSEHRLAGDVWVVGQDAELSACQRIVEGTQGMTVYKAVDKEAKIAAEAAMALIRGEKVDTKETCFDGTYEVPFIQLQPVAVTKENIDATIIKDNYHLKEDVYLNLE